MSKHLQRDLDNLQRDILAMASLVELNIHKAIRALSERNVDLAREIIQDEAQIDGLALRGKHAPRPGSPAAAPGRELAEAVQAAAAGLPASLRGVYALADVEGVPEAEVGGRLGLSPEAVRCRLSRARLLVRRALGPFLAGPPAWVAPEAAE